MAEETSAAQIGPTRELTKRQMVETVDIRDEAGWQVRTSRTVDTIGRLLRKGLIGSDEAAAANWFRARFHIGHLDPAKASDPARPFINGSNSAPESSEPQRRIDARSAVWDAMHAVGPIDSPASRILYDVVGRDHTISEWVEHQSFGGFDISRDQAVGLLVGSLNALAAYWVRRRRDREIEQQEG